MHCGEARLRWWFNSAEVWNDRFGLLLFLRRGRHHEAAPFRLQATVERHEGVQPHKLGEARAVLVGAGAAVAVAPALLLELSRNSRTDTFFGLLWLF